MKNKLLQLGQVVATNRVAEIMSNDPEYAHRVTQSLLKHAKGDWGVVCAEDASLNDAALEKDDDRILSSYDIDPKTWIITEWDRSVTTVLLPEKY